MPPCINATISIIKIAIKFSKNESVGGVEGRSEFFQKIIRFGSRTLPLAFQEDFDLFFTKPNCVEKSQIYESESEMDD